MGSGISGLYTIGSFDYTINSTDSESLRLHEDNQQFNITRTNKATKHKKTIGTNTPHPQSFKKNSIP